jgi:hypothetical protein
MSCIEKIQREYIASMTVKRKAVKAYVAHCEKYFNETVYSDQCRTWMRGCKNYPDRVIAIYPGSYLHFRKVLGNPRWEDFEYEMVDEDNIFAFFGNGMTEQDMDMKGNFSPYMSLEEEYPELRDHFVRDGKINGVTSNGVAVNGKLDNGDAHVHAEKNGVITLENGVVSGVPVTL